MRGHGRRGGTRASWHAFEIGPAEEESKLSFLKQTLNLRHLKKAGLQMPELFSRTFPGYDTAVIDTFFAF